MEYRTDIEAYENCPPEYRWAFNKLEVCNRMGYYANPSEIPVSKTALYCVKPIINLNGMGKGSTQVLLQSGESYDKPGYFYMDWFNGKHLSVDYNNKGEVLSVYEGIQHDVSKLWKWDMWIRRSETIAPAFPKELEELFDVSDYFNIEWIDGKLIEIHLRQTDAVERLFDIYIPQFQDGTVGKNFELSEKGYIFIAAEDTASEKRRIGFWTKKF